MNAYYITFTYRQKSNGLFDNTTTYSWRIIRTEHDLDSINGLHQFILDYENNYNSFYLTSWRRLADESKATRSAA